MAMPNLTAADAPRVLDVLMRTTNASAPIRNQAVQELDQLTSSVSQATGFAPALLHIASDASYDGVSRQMAAVTLKNLIKKTWDPRHSDFVIQEGDKALVREGLFSATMFAAPLVRRSLAEAVTLICAVDFPESYGSVLDEILAVLGRASTESLADPAVSDAVHAALSLAHGVFARYRNLYELTEETKQELLSINANTAETIICLLETSAAAAAEAHDLATAKAAVDVLSITVEVLHDLTTCDLGEEHMRNLNRIVASLVAALRLDIPSLQGDAYSGGPLMTLRASVLDVIAFYMQQFDDEMEPFAWQLLQVVWQLLCGPGSQTAAADDLVVSGLSFLESVCRSVHKQHLPQVLPQLCTDIIVPNLTISEEDMENFEFEPHAYFQRDVEGSDVHTRRHSACQLVRALMGAFGDQAIPLLQECIERLLATGTWQGKDSAMALVTAMALRVSAATSMEHDASTVELTHAVDLAAFYATHVEPELIASTDYAATDPGSCMGKADAVRFVATFRHFLPAEGLAPLAAHLSELLQHSCVVLHTYAAHTVERLVTALVERSGAAEAGAQLAEGTPRLLELLCTRLQTDKKLNDHTIKCLARVLKTAPEASAGYVSAVAGVLATVLAEMAKNPSNPLFSHYIFEALASAVAANPSQTPAIEAAVWDPLLYVLREEVVELLPYALQLLAIMLDHHPSQAVPSPSTSTQIGEGASIPEYYMELCGPLLTPSIYAHKGNVPAAVRLLSAFIRRNGAQVHAAGHTPATLSTAAQLLQSRTQDHYGFEIVGAFVMHYPDDVLSQQLPRVFRVLFDRMQKASTQKYSRMLALFCCSVMASKGGSYFEGLMEHIQPGMTAMVLGRIVLPVVPKVTGELERKTCAVGIAKVLQECPGLLNDGTMWAQCVFQTLTLLHLDAEKDDAAVGEGPLTAKEQQGRVEELRNAAVEESGVGSKYVQLSSVPPPVDDPCGAVADPRAYFRAAMKAIVAAQPDVMGLLQSHLPAEAFNTLLSHVA